MCAHKSTGEFQMEELHTVKLIGKSKMIDLKDTILSDKSPIEYDVGFLMNSCDQGYGIFTMDDHSMYFIEKYLSDIYNKKSDDGQQEFTKTHLQVVLDTIFKMMENGLYSVSKLNLLLLHILQIKKGGVHQEEEQSELENSPITVESLLGAASNKEENEEIILDQLVKFWSRAVTSWLPIQNFLDIC